MVSKVDTTFDAPLDYVQENIGYLLGPNLKTPDPALLGVLGINVVERMASALSKVRGPRELGKLWASDIGESCNRKLWMKFKDPGGEEPIPSHTQVKFIYGDLVEEIILYLMAEAGYKVSDRQHRVEKKLAGWTISGRIDAIINGRVVDVKSTSSFGFKKYAGNTLEHADDTFGYIHQLNFYKNMLSDQTVGLAPKFIWVDKQLGKVQSGGSAIIAPAVMDLDLKYKFNAIESKLIPAVPSHLLPELTTGGNSKLVTKCSYCGFKSKCFNYKTYLYSTGPIYLANVAKEPRVPMIGENAL